MKAKLTISVDEHVVPQAKRYAKRHGTSLSGLTNSTSATPLAVMRPLSLTAGAGT